MALKAVLEEKENDHKKGFASSFGTTRHCRPGFGDVDSQYKTMLWLLPSSSTPAAITAA
jgi:hypothetical protein